MKHYLNWSEHSLLKLIHDLKFLKFYEDVFTAVLFGL